MDDVVPTPMGMDDHDAAGGGALTRNLCRDVARASLPLAHKVCVYRSDTPGTRRPLRLELPLTSYIRC